MREHTQLLGGKIETFDFCFGTYHVVTIIEYPDDETMEAIAMAVYASGAIKDLNITVLVPMENAVRAMTRARAAGYPAPSGLAPATVPYLENANPWTPTGDFGHHEIPVTPMTVPREAAWKGE